MIIDANMYWFPEEFFTNDNLMNLFLSEIPKEYGINGYVITDEKTNGKQIVIEKPRGYQNLNYAQYDYILENQLADMDKAGIDKAVLKIPGCQEWMDLDLCRQFNDAIYRHVMQSNGRLFALAVVPPLAVPECIYELERCKYELGMNGVQLSAHYGNLYLDDDVFRPFFEKLNDLEMTAYIHHTPLPVQFESLYEYNNLRRSYGRCVDQTIAIGRELFSGLFKKYPKLKFVHSMLGGGFFAYKDLMLPYRAKNKEHINRFETENDEVRNYLANNIFFEMSHAQPWGKVQLECAISALGADHIIFGSSYPIRKEWLLEGVDFVKQLNISDEEKELILYKNAKKLYNL
jgi:predicted TIM-barrel fold metal-dependent hydrolase